MIPRRWVRARALGFCLWYGLAPSRWYEPPPPHYLPDTYLQHLWLNLAYAARWLFGRQTWGDVRFEVAKNGSGRR